MFRKGERVNLPDIDGVSVTVTQCLWSTLRGCPCPCESMQIGWPTRSQQPTPSLRTARASMSAAARVRGWGDKPTPWGKSEVLNTREPEERGGWGTSGLQIPAGCLPDLQYSPAPRQLASPRLATSLLKRGDTSAFSSIFRSRLGIVGNWVNFQTCSVEGKDQYPRATCS